MPVGPDSTGIDSVLSGVSGIACDSRKVLPGWLFLAVKGANDDGARYIEDARRRGALRCIECSREELAEIACRFHGNPSAKMKVFAVTGTNGKTTVAGLVRDCLERAGVKTGLVSTVETYDGADVREASRTTPDACELQALLHRMADAGCGAVSMEASSHALDQSRTGGTRFEACGFTNLSRDHLDYHHDFEEYFRAKERLFRQLDELNPAGAAVVNVDDPYGVRLAESVPHPVTYGIGAARADVVATGLALGSAGSRFVLSAFGRCEEIESGLMGRYNVSNMLCAAGMAISGGAPFDAVVETLRAARPRWGRLEKVGEANGASVFVDYAHTPDAIEKVLVALREITRRRLMIVFGCGGDRDRVKRPQMAEVATRLADFAVLTSDNPRTEDPEAILDEVQAGASRTAGWKRICDRREAIEFALGGAGEGDVVVIAGKGHENYQEVNGVKHHFDDREEVRRIISAE